MNGTHLDVPVVRVVDGDTIRVELDGNEESLRILALDTEESSASSDKPETRWGHAAKAEAQRLVQPGDMITIEFPGTEPLAESLEKYRGNFGRPLVYVHLVDGTDYQEHMIRAGFSPYFNKYGNAVFLGHHARYVAAERDAQLAFDDEGAIGVWNQIRVNGVEARNYAALGTWWALRAEIIDQYRALKAAQPALPLYNTRLDHEELVTLAERGEQVTVFTELRSHQRIGGNHAVVRIGSQHQPFQLFIRDVDLDEGQRIVRLLDTRYVPGEGDDHPRRSYAYVRGTLALFRGRPEMAVSSVDQITDGVPG